MIYTSRPKIFNSRFEIVSCFLEFDGKILLLHRYENKSQGGKWGVPAGKVDSGEDLLQAMKRELQEETGIEINVESLKYLTSVFVKYDEYDFIYHMYRHTLENKPEVVLSVLEHQNYQWVEARKTQHVKLVDDLDKCIDMYYM